MKHTNMYENLLQERVGLFELLLYTFSNPMGSTYAHPRIHLKTQPKCKSASFLNTVLFNANIYKTMTKCSTACCWQPDPKPKNAKTYWDKKCTLTLKVFSSIVAEKSYSLHQGDDIFPASKDTQKYVTPCSKAKKCQNNWDKNVRWRWRCLLALL